MPMIAISESRALFRPRRCPDLPTPEVHATFRALFFDWRIASPPAARRSQLGCSPPRSPFCLRRSAFSFGGVLDSTLGRSAPLHVEVGSYLVNSPAKKLSGNYEEMPLAA